MSGNISRGNGFVAPPGSTPVRKRLLREAVTMIERGVKMNAAIDAIYDQYCAEPLRQSDVETSVKNTKAIEKGVRRLMKQSSNARISVPPSP